MVLLLVIIPIWISFLIFIIYEYQVSQIYSSMKLNFEQSVRYVLIENDCLKVSEIPYSKLESDMLSFYEILYDEAVVNQLSGFEISVLDDSVTSKIIFSNKMLGGLTLVPITLTINFKVDSLCS